MLWTRNCTSFRLSLSHCVLLGDTENAGLAKAGLENAGLHGKRGTVYFTTLATSAFHSYWSRVFHPLYDGPAFFSQRVLHPCIFDGPEFSSPAFSVAPPCALGRGIDDHRKHDVDRSVYTVARKMCTGKLANNSNMSNSNRFAIFFARLQTQ